MSHNKSQLAFNVGFLLHQPSGYSRLYDFELDSTRFSEDFTIHNLKGSLQLTRSTDGLLAQGSFEGTTAHECTRCLEQFLAPLEVEFNELLMYPASKAEDPVLGIPESATLDLRPLLRESFLIAIPLQPRCKPDCKGLCPVCGNNLNLSECSHEAEDVDPRLEVLKKLLD